MKFEEMKAIIDKYQGEAGTATGGNVDNLIYSGLDVHNMLNEISDNLEELEEIYAPKIKMTKTQQEWFSSKKGYELEDIMVSRWEMPTVSEKGYTDSAEQIREISDKTLALAWLHPELIEVVE